jgi:IS30 family transposase
MTYSQLTREQRYQIFAFKKAGYSQGRIAEEVGCHKSTISRELRRNAGARGYSPKQAQGKADARQEAKPRAVKFCREYWGVVEAMIRQEFSPEQVAGVLKANGAPVTISHEWIYRHVERDRKAGGDLHRHLRCWKPRRRRHGQGNKRGGIKGRVPISERPTVVEEKSRVGDWELDTVVGKGHQSALVTAVERKSLYTLIARVEDKTAETVGDALVASLLPHAKKVFTLTSDNGTEFAGHARVAAALGAGFYFADPYSSWQRGVNENTNGLIRQYFPKKTDFREITDAEVEQVAYRLNHRPRKTLGFRTPQQVFHEENIQVSTG